MSLTVLQDIVYDLMESVIREPMFSYDVGENSNICHGINEMIINKMHNLYNNADIPGSEILKLIASIILDDTGISYCFGRKSIKGKKRIPRDGKPVSLNSYKDVENMVKSRYSEIFGVDREYWDRVDIPTNRYIIEKLSSISTRLRVRRKRKSGLEFAKKYNPIYYNMNYQYHESIYDMSDFYIV